MPHAGNPPDVRPMRRGAVAAVVLAIGLSLTACAGPGPGGPGGTTSAPTQVTGTGSEPSGAPSLSVDPPIPSSGAVTTLQGTVTEGVEAGCVVLVDGSGAVLANLQGWDVQSYPFDSNVEVTGTFEPDLMTICQQGPPFEVISAELR